MRYSKQYHACLVELWNWRKSFRGAGVRNTRQGVSIAPPPPRRPPPTDLGTGGSNSLMPVLLTQTGGANAAQDGSGNWHAASYRYTASDLNSNVLALDMPLYTQRATWQCSAGTAGLIVLAPQLALASPGTDPGGIIATPYRLWWTDESPTLDNGCEGN